LLAVVRAASEILSGTRLTIVWRRQDSDIGCGSQSLRLNSIWRGSGQILRDIDGRVDREIDGRVDRVVDGRIGRDIDGRVARDIDGWNRRGLQLDSRGAEIGSGNEILGEC
jgi:hypothetical protein